MHVSKKQKDFMEFFRRDMWLFVAQLETPNLKENKIDTEDLRKIVSPSLENVSVSLSFQKHAILFC